MIIQELPNMTVGDTVTLHVNIDGILLTDVSASAIAYSGQQSIAASSIIIDTANGANRLIVTFDAGVLGHKLWRLQFQIQNNDNEVQTVAKAILKMTKNYLISQ